jgi:hypothetical protein
LCRKSQIKIYDKFAEIPIQTFSIASIVSRLEIEGMISKEFQRQWRISEVVTAILFN